MLRVFKEHEVREVLSLDYFWNFARTEGTDPKEVPDPLPSVERRVRTPSAWETLPGLEDYRGQAWYWTELPSLKPGHYTLRFGGVSHTANVFLNGIHIGRHYDAFTPFECNFEIHSEETATLAVHIDNSFGPHSALHIENDYYTYGGITRPVELHRVSPDHIERVHLTPLRENGRWVLLAKIRLFRSTSSEPLAVRLEIPALQKSESVKAPADATEVKLVLEDLDAKAWSDSHPHLYQVKASLLLGEETIDDKIERIGFRTIETEGTELLLNGEPIRLKGFNRHEDHPQFGNALPVEAMMADLELIRNSGANCIRTSHYPNDSRFLDLCDEMGFLVWEESHARIVDMTVPVFREQMEASTREMIEFHFNHPSIILWGALNECASETEEGRKEFERVFRQIKKLDPSRPTTFASCKHYKDLCLDLVDVISFNMYPAWYSGSPSAVGPDLEKFLAWHERENPGDFKNKPFIVSEFGAGGIYGNRQRSASKWSEEYQVKALDESLRIYLNHPRVAGILIWQFCDCRVTFGYWHARPRSHNNKGIVDEYRRPKMVFETVRDHFSSDSPASHWNGQ